jgi:hypothetical protein
VQNNKLIPINSLWFFAAIAIVYLTLEDGASPFEEGSLSNYALSLISCSFFCFVRIIIATFYNNLKTFL